MLIGSGKIISALIGAVCGALFATLGGIYKDARDRRRQTLATVLLCELRSAEVSLRHLYDSRSGTFPTKAFEVFELKDSMIELFGPDTARLILDFTAKLSGVRDLIEADSDGQIQTTSEKNPVLSAYIAATVGLVPELKEALEDEGGEYIPYVEPEMPESSDGESKPPPLDDSPFPDITNSD
jgi:hypothetical protein